MIQNFSREKYSKQKDKKSQLRSDIKARETTIKNFLKKHLEQLELSSEEIEEHLTHDMDYEELESCLREVLVRETEILEKLELEKEKMITLSAVNEKDRLLR